MWSQSHKFSIPVHSSTKHDVCDFLASSDDILEEAGLRRIRIGVIK